MQKNINVWVPIYVFPEMKLCCLIIFRPELLCSVSQFPHSCICERFVYSQDRSTTYFAAAKKADRSWEYINRSQIHVHECRNWERGRTFSFLRIHKSDFRYLANCKTLCQQVYNFMGLQKVLSMNMVIFSQVNLVKNSPDRCALR
jgi:hypothetical protein